MVIDNLLSPIVLEKVRDYLMMSTFYYDVKTPRYGRYVGSYMNDGLHDKLVMAVAFELHKATPRVTKGHAIKALLTYKTSLPRLPRELQISQQAFTLMRTMLLSVSIFGLHPANDANLDPTSGGLVVFTAKPPNHWDSSSFNSNWEYVEEHW